jgi:hypothetical protein
LGVRGAEATLRDRTGATLGAPVAATEAHAVHSLVRRWTNWQFVRTLRRDIPGLETHAGLRPRGAKWSDPPLARAVAPGEAFDIVLRNDADQRLYFTVLALEEDGSVAIIAPAPGADLTVDSDEEWSITQRSSEPARFSIRVVVTTAMADFGFLQEGARSPKTQFVDDDYWEAHAFEIEVRR